MYQTLRKYKEKTKYYVLFTVVITFFLLLTVVFKNDEGVINKKTNVAFQYKELTAVKEFLLSRIQSPFINISYELKSGDSIQKILKKFKIRNNEIGTIISQYKKYAKPNQLLTGNIIDIIIEKDSSKTNNSIVKFSVPITKSTTIELTKDERGKIISKKIITKLYKKRTLSGNIIKKNLYSSALEVKINPDTIIEFARIFGFEIDFQRDIRKNDHFKIVYDKYFDENGEFIKSGSILYAHMTVNDREITLYKFGDDKSYGYFDVNGKSVEKALTKTPINGARLSSSFGMRKHPILGFNKMHKGTDFAAAEGTPIMASGTGIIVSAKWCGGGDMHTDGVERPPELTPKHFGFMAKNISRSGGKSWLVSGPQIYLILKKSAPKLLEVLHTDFYFSLKGDKIDGKEFTVKPIFFKSGEKNGFDTIGVQYLRQYIHQGHELAKEPLTEIQNKALDVLDYELVHPDNLLVSDYIRGGIYFFNNYHTLHGRSSFEDLKGDRKRELLRIWTICS